MKRHLLTIALVVAGSAGIASAQAVQIDSTERVLEIRGKESGDLLGRPVLCADLNGDGYDDLLVGSDRSSYSGAQRPTLHIIRGSANIGSTGLLDLAATSADTVVLGETGSSAFPRSLAAGDVNNDGYLDLIAADSSLTVSGRTAAGAVYVIFGGIGFFNTATYDLAANDWDVKILGATAGDDMGGSLFFGGGTAHALAAGDVTGDGIADIVMGAHLADAGSRSGAGVVRMVKGRNPFPPGTTIDLATKSDATILGVGTYDEFGTNIVIGDVNADGTGDIVVGNEYASLSTFSSEGSVFAFFGSTTFPSTIDLGSQSASLRITGPAAGTELGSAIALSDFNGDGRADVLAAAGGWDAAGDSSIDHGAVYGFAGGSSLAGNYPIASSAFLVKGYATENNIGSTVAGGDFNGDGVGDFLYSSRDGERSGFSSEGRTYITFGSASALPTQFLVQNEEADVIINGGVDGLQLGDAVASGDLDGDGADEILIAAPFIDSGTGRLYVFDLTPPPASAERTWTLYE
ncbi:MAG: hypothetical protein PWP23_1373 [Candidatus Sumerlaeota bacterium]|nr:hypothetical protein [Candidatus Sumerlaeota bacterium]